MRCVILCKPTQQHYSIAPRSRQTDREHGVFGRNVAPGRGFCLCRMYKFDRRIGGNDTANPPLHCVAGMACCPPWPGAPAIRFPPRQHRRRTPSGNQCAALLSRHEPGRAGCATRLTKAGTGKPGARGRTDPATSPLPHATRVRFARRSSAGPGVRRARAGAQHQQSSPPSAKTLAFSGSRGYDRVR